MHSDAWSSFAPEVSAALHRSSACPVAYGTALELENADVFAAIAQHVKLDGIGDDLLSMVAPAAQGDFILAFQVFGELESARRRPVLVAHGGSGSGSSGRPTVSDAPTRLVSPTRPALEISAIVFSVRLRRTVADLTMKYAGSSMNDAIQQFARKLALTFPAAVCGEWDWTAVRAIRELDAAGLPLRRVRLVPTVSR